MTARTKGAASLIAVLAGLLCGYLLGVLTEVSPPPSAPPPEPDPELASLEKELQDLRRWMRSSAWAPSEEAARTAADAPETAARNGNLRLSLVDEDGKPRAGTTGTVYWTDRGGERKNLGFTSDGEGVAALDGLEPGSYSIHVSLVIQRNPAGAHGSRSLEAHVEAGRTTALSVILPRGTVVEGTLRRADGRVCPGARVSLLSGAPERCSFGDGTDEEGRFRIESVPPGTYVATVMHGGLGIRNLRYWTVTVDDEPLTKDLLVGIPRLRGTVRDREGIAVPGSKVLIRGRNLNSETTVTDTEGAFVFDDLGPGDYSVVFFGDGHVTTSRKVTLEEQGEAWVDASLDPAAALILSVTDPEGKPFVGDLFLYFKTPAGERAVSGTIRVDSRGRGAYRRVPPGRYTLLAKAAGIGSAEIAGVVVREGENRLEIRLR